jgi:hypothetical protein
MRSTSFFGFPFHSPTERVTIAVRPLIADAMASMVGFCAKKPSSRPSDAQFPKNADIAFGLSGARTRFDHTRRPLYPPPSAMWNSTFTIGLPVLAVRASDFATCAR